MNLYKFQTMKSHFFKLGVFIGFCFFQLFASSQSINFLQEKYVWNNVAIGGGGYVTGIVAHPKEKNLIYIRTDVGGAYRWNETEKRWIQLCNGFGIDQWNLYGIESIAIDPNNADIVYMAAGKYDKTSLKNRAKSSWGWQEGEPEPSDILKSTDKGKTWSSTGLHVDNTANKGIYRNAGERLVVDPNRSEVIYFGSRFDGLWLNTKAGDRSAWKELTQFPTRGIPGIGISFVLIDEYSKVENEPSHVIYAGVPGTGIFLSKNRGDDWQLLAGGPLNPMRAICLPSGVIFVTHDNGVAKFESGKWTDVTPDGKHQVYCAIGFNPFDTNMLMTGVRKGLNSQIYLSKNGGKLWEKLSYTRSPNVPWWPKKYWASATSAILFDPLNSGRVWYTNWYGTWRTDDIDESSSKWVTYEQGHEEMCVFKLLSTPSGGNLFTCIADNDGNRHTSLDKYPVKSYDNPELQETTSIDFCESNPVFMARVGSWNWGKKGGGAVSSDNGQTWEPFATMPMDSIYCRHGRIACSASNPEVMIWLPEKEKPFLSENRGKTWKLIEGLPENAVQSFWSYCQPLASDRVDGNTFYFYQGGRFYVSTNGGSD